MIGGIIVQKLGDCVEVLEAPHSFSRCWRKLERPDEARDGDQIWWESFTGYLSRGDEFKDRNIGRCTPIKYPPDGDVGPPL